MTDSVAPIPSRFFALLQFLQISQNDVAAHLGVGHTIVSLWKHGKKPIPTLHHAALQDLVMERMDKRFQQLHQAVERAQEHAQTASATVEALLAAREAIPLAELTGQLPSEPLDTMHATAATLDTAHTAFETFVQTFQQYWDDWLIELYEARGDLHRTLYAQCHVLGEYGQHQPPVLTEADQQRMRDACTTILRQLRYLDRLAKISSITAQTALPKPPKKPKRSTG
jgi:hypothetical protein